MRELALALAVLAIPGSILADGPPDLSLTLRVRQQTVITSAPVVLSLEIRNTSNHEVILPWPEFIDRFITTEIEDRHQGTVTMCHPGLALGAGKFPGGLLKHGESLHVELTTHVVDGQVVPIVLKPGQLKVRCTYDGSRIPAAYECFEGKVSSRVVPVDVRTAAEHFPQLHGRFDFCEQRLLSPNRNVRIDLLARVWNGPLDPESEKLLRYFLHDPDGHIQVAMAFFTLATHDLSISRDELPRNIFGFDQLNKRALDARLKEWRRFLGTQAPTGGMSALALGVFGDKGDFPALRTQTEHANIFLRFCAAVALIHLGDETFGEAALRRISLRGLGDGYVLKAYLILHRRGDRDAVPGLVKRIVSLRHKQIAPDASVLKLLAAMTGEWHDDAVGWGRWLERRNATSVNAARKGSVR